jgi:putative transposase
VLVKKQEPRISLRTYHRWTVKDALTVGDKRVGADNPAPKKKLIQAERESILAVCNSVKYASLPPSQIVPSPLDEGVYIGSLSTFYRRLKQVDQLAHRGRSKVRKAVSKPTTYTASKANEVWSWDITYCHSKVRGQYYYLYMIKDIYSSKIVSYEVHKNECGIKAGELLERTCWR